MLTYLAVTPTQVSTAQRWCHTLAHVAYSIGRGSRLLRNSLLVQTRGGLLVLTDRDAPPIEDPGALCAAALRECNRRGYSGVLADFEDPPTPDRQAFLSQLSPLLRRNRRSLFVPQAYGVPGAVPVLCTALSGGNFQEFLCQAVSSSPLPALDVERVRMDFPLPAPSGEGTPLSQEAFRQLVAQKQPSIFYTPELCAKYFTYTEGDQGHFVLFDDAATLREKLRLAAKMGISVAFFQFPEVEDLLEELFSPQRDPG